MSSLCENECPFGPNGGFNASKSTSHYTSDIPSAQIRYTDGTTLTGVIARDTITLAGQSVSNFPFIEATSYTGNTISSGYDGIMGFMHTPRGEQPDGSLRVVWSKVLFDQNPTMSKLFSFTVYQGEEEGELVLGGVNLARIQGPIQQVPALTDTLNAKKSPVYTFWQSQLSHFYSPSLSNNISMQQLITFDTGTSLVYLPFETAKALNEGLGFVMYNDTGSQNNVNWGMSCQKMYTLNSLKEITIVFGNQATMIIRPHLYTVTSDNITCYSIFFGTMNSNFIFGNVLLRQFTMIFDWENNRIAFALAKRAVNIPPLLNASYSLIL